VGARGFVLCPRGRKTHFGVSDEYSAYYFPNHHWLRRALHASLTAVQTQYRKHLDATRAVYVGFSQGAIMGALTVAPEPTRFPRAVFIEGGGSEWNVPIASAYLRGGGKRVAFACGVKSCHLQAQRAVRYLRRAGVPARAAYVPGAGHTYGAALAPAVRSVFEWVVVGDPRWR
jgi:predicted esterase